MATSAEQIPYERLMTARPALLWALERHWPGEVSAIKGMELDANENSAWLILKGEARVTHGENQHLAGPGCWMFPKPGKRKQSFAGEFHFLSVTIRWQWPEGRHLFDEGLTGVLAASDAPMLESTAREIIESVKQVSSVEYYQIGMHPVSVGGAARLFELAGKWASAYAMAMDQLGVSPDTGANRDPRVESLLARLRECGSSSSPDRASLAASAGVSPRQLDRMLKEATGKTLAETHDRYRFESACCGLLEKGLRVKEVAAENGFHDLSSFSRWFTKHAGCSPRSYRDRFTNPG